MSSCETLWVQHRGARPARRTLVVVTTRRLSPLSLGLATVAVTREAFGGRSSFSVAAQQSAATPPAKAARAESIEEMREHSQYVDLILDCDALRLEAGCDAMQPAPTHPIDRFGTLDYQDSAPGASGWTRIGIDRATRFAQGSGTPLRRLRLL